MKLFLVNLVTTACMPQFTDAEIVAIGAGLARSGTNSLKAAFETLLQSESISLSDVAGTDKLSDWLRFFKDRTNRTLLRSLVDGYSSVSSLPGAFAYKELLEEFPNAKVVLTRHPKGPEAWYSSTMGTIARLNYEIFNATWIGMIPKVKYVHAQLREMYLDSAFMAREEWLQKDVAIARYEAWNAEVERFVPKHQLLIFSASQGWEPLCKFLDKPVPTLTYPWAFTHGSNLKRVVTILHIARFVVPLILLIAVTCVCRRCLRKQQAVKID
eukprot:gnl/TRDRNA2_/TRDRNA2_129200_c0_seq1.p1 gnl/TRDRNA2_/TRDRNA2_129200_c0~~gnl/TRDRNA2_/TRDRNA2_129200_c0_seq1.p1  ORF type:complete len:270 (-),score=28.94 gnl/TRDRNA2_/TRDRNA2_129200_c0_seq1:82-891(-)